MDRPTFFNAGSTDQVKAGGLLLYKRTNDGIKFLMANYFGKYEDLGGKTDSCDESIIDTISREVSEESNGIITSSYVKNLLKDQKYIYIKNSKYILYICEATDDYNPRDFDDIEYHTNLPRRIEWIDINDVTDTAFHYKLNFRLRNRMFFSRVSTLS